MDANKSMAVEGTLRTCRTSWSTERSGVGFSLALDRYPRSFSEQQFCGSGEAVGERVVRAEGRRRRAIVQCRKVAQPFGSLGRCLRNSSDNQQSRERHARHPTSSRARRGRRRQWAAGRLIVRPSLSGQQLHGVHNLHRAAAWLAWLHGLRTSSDSADVASSHRFKDICIVLVSVLAILRPRRPWRSPSVPSMCVPAGLAPDSP